MALISSIAKIPCVLCAILAGSAALAQGVADAGYPRKPIRLVLPFPPGGGTDAMARIIAIKLGEVLGQTMVIENRAGAAGNLSAEFVAKSPPDGHTLFMEFSSVMTTNKALYKNMAVDPVKDFAPITQLATSQYIVVVHPSLPVRSIAQLVALANAIAVSLYPKLAYDPLRDFGAVTQMGSSPFVLVVHPGVKALSVQELVSQFMKSEIAKWSRVVKLSGAKAD